MDAGAHSIYALEPTLCTKIGSPHVVCGDRGGHGQSHGVHGGGRDRGDRDGATLFSYWILRKRCVYLGGNGRGEGEGGVEKGRGTESVRNRGGNGEKEETEKWKGGREGGKGGGNITGRREEVMEKRER